MADRNKYLADSSLLDLSDGSVGFYIVPQMSSTDTVTLGDFSTLNRVDGFTADDIALAFTVSGNIATLTGIAGGGTVTNAKVYLFAQGKR